ncbi:MAG: sulfide/dihydroorotate dehydrogenase-like FAD/NAD-binding protein [candidate division Zixibacteria bacterium]|nr:sulfide/dihydroorotate dehydrogenase-like FAD/NAD-binding protein [candidate division Zixibacteria bacterium]
MVKVLEHYHLGENNYKIVFEVPELVKKAQPGQFVVLRISEEGERIPMSIGDMDPEKGSLTVIYQVIGKTTALMATLKPGEHIMDCVGPLGNPSHVDKKGKYMVIGGGIGIAPVHPAAKKARENGNEVFGIIGARTKDLLFFEDEMRKACDHLYVCTDDGSYGEKGFVTDVLKRLIDEGNKPDFILAIGPVPMMKAVCATSKPYDIETWVSVNPIMIDGTGMCGACRVSVGGITKFGCVDGPDFDGHLLDFDELTSRLRMYHQMEKESMEQFEKKQPCYIGLKESSKKSA